MSIPKPQVRYEYPNWGAGVWVGAQVDPLKDLLSLKLDREIHVV